MGVSTKIWDKIQSFEFRFTGVGNGRILGAQIMMTNPLCLHEPRQFITNYENETWEGVNESPQ